MRRFSGFTFALFSSRTQCEVNSGRLSVRAPPETQTGQDKGGLGMRPRLLAGRRNPECHAGARSF